MNMSKSERNININRNGNGNAKQAKHKDDAVWIAHSVTLLAEDRDMGAAHVEIKQS